MRISRTWLAAGAIVLACAGCGAAHQTRLQREVAVIRAWSGALRRGDVGAAAAYFALPSTFANGPTITIHDHAEARLVNESLPCGARLASATRRGRYVEAIFVLTGRPGPGGTDCGSGAGTRATTDFLIRNGRIAAWIRAPSAPGSSVSV